MKESFRLGDLVVPVTPGNDDRPVSWLPPRPPGADSTTNYGNLLREGNRRGSRLAGRRGFQSHARQKGVAPHGSVPALTRTMTVRARGQFWGRPQHCPPPISIDLVMVGTQLPRKITR